MTPSGSRGWITSTPGARGRWHGPRGMAAVDREGSAAGVYMTTSAWATWTATVSSSWSSRDTITIAAYEPDGSQLMTDELPRPAGPRHGHLGGTTAYVDLAYETQGGGPVTRNHGTRELRRRPANVADVNGDGVNEVVVIGNVHDFHTSLYTNLYNAPYILDLDRPG